jgi:ribosome-binding protein aMBF1 (putative translation factor)
VDWDEEELDSDEANECEECGAEGANPYWADEDGYCIWLCDDCAHRTCQRCGEGISGRPIPVWVDEIGEEVWLCERCAAATDGGSGR